MNKLKELRQAAGLSTRKLSDALGGRISHSEIVQLENGGRNFSGGIFSISPNISIFGVNNTHFCVFSANLAIIIQKY